MSTPQPNMGANSELTRAMPEVGSVVAEKFRLDSLLGEGGMGAVYAATHLLTSKPVALKWMLPDAANNNESVSRFLREARAAGQIDHPNVVDIYDVGTTEEGAPFLVMERMRGRSLEDLLDGGAVSPATAVRLLLPAMRGIAAAHRHGVVHRDLKPDNLFVCEDEAGLPVDTKVLDFGISKIAGDEVGSLTVTGAVMGTPHYMSPEQIRGSKDVDALADVYALGVILYQAVTGELPFTATTFTALAVEIATEEPTPPSEHVPTLHPELERLILKTLAKDRDDRFPSVDALARALDPFTDGARFDDSSGTIRISERPAAMKTPTGSEPTARAAGEQETLAATPAAMRSERPFVASELPTDSSRPRVLGLIALALVLLVAVGAWTLSGDSSETVEEIAEVPAPPEPPAEPAVEPPPVEAAVAPVAATPTEEEPVEDVEPVEPRPLARGRARTRRARRQPTTETPPEAETSVEPAGRGGVRTTGVSLDDF